MHNFKVGDKVKVYYSTSSSIGGSSKFDNAFENNTIGIITDIVDNCLKIYTNKSYMSATVKQCRKLVKKEKKKIYVVYDLYNYNRIVSIRHNKHEAELIAFPGSLYHIKEYVECTNN